MAFNKIKSLFVLIMNGKTKVLDFGYLNKYKTENALIPAPVLEEKRIVFFGDSITEGWKTIHPDFFVGKSYINRGINGQTTSQMLLRFRQDVIDLKPKMVVILAGTNDIAGNTGPTTPETIFGNLISMCELFPPGFIFRIICTGWEDLRFESACEIPDGGGGGGGGIVPKSNSSPDRLLQCIDSSITI